MIGISRIVINKKENLNFLKGAGYQAKIFRYLILRPKEVSVPLKKLGTSCGSSEGL